PCRPPTVVCPVVCTDPSPRWSSKRVFLDPNPTSTAFRSSLLPNGPLLIAPDTPWQTCTLQPCPTQILRRPMQALLLRSAPLDPGPSDELPSSNPPRTRP